MAKKIVRFYKVAVLCACTCLVLSGCKSNNDSETSDIEISESDSEVVAENDESEDEVIVDESDNEIKEKKKEEDAKAIKKALRKAAKKDLESDNNVESGENVTVVDDLDLSDVDLDSDSTQTTSDTTDNTDLKEDKADKDVDLEDNSDDVYHSPTAEEACQKAGIDSFNPVPVFGGEEEPQANWYALKGEAVEAEYRYEDGADIRIRKGKNESLGFGTRQDERLPVLKETGTVLPVSNMNGIRMMASDDGSASGAIWQRDGYYYWIGVFNRTEEIPFECFTTTAELTR